MKILIADDSRLIRQLVTECLKDFGHDLAYAEDGGQCLEYIANNDVDLVLMDIEMPELNGIDATKAIRELKKEDWFPIVFLTTRDEDKTFASGILAGGDAYLLKPINPLRLQHTIIALERIYVMRRKLQRAQQEMQKLNQELERLSYFDQLTGLANRRNFDQTLERQFALARRNKSPLSLIICDVDFFKIYNDSYGHQRGDDCLGKVGKALGSQVRRGCDLACRYGGEEFTVILPETNLMGARVIAENVRQAVYEQAIPHCGSKVADRVSLSLGVATYTGQYLQGSELLKAADEALYRAKENGRNRMEVAA
ncbi:MAG: diguanylate cyclase [Methylomonas sp.]|nr:diguanylate cyclase [Methylomonas sp.]